MTRHYCTYFDQNYLVKALSLISSLIAHDKNFLLYVVCLDEITYKLMRQLGFNQVKLLTIFDIESFEPRLLSAKQNRTLIEYYWTLTPTVIAYVLSSYPDADKVVYLDADLFFYSSPDPIFDEFSDASVLIHSHRFPEHKQFLAVHGIYNVGLLGFKNNSEAHKVLSWWQDSCIEWCYDRVEGDKYGDQKYLDNWPAKFAGVAVLKNLGAGVAPWNHEQYLFNRSESGSVLVDNNPLIFYHFHSFVIVLPFLFILSKHCRTYGINDNVVEYCFIPYIESIVSAINIILKIMPEFRSGIENISALKPEHTFIAPISQHDQLSAAGINNNYYDISAKFRCYYPIHFRFISPNISYKEVVTVATSIAPGGIEKQIRAVNSWNMLGLNIISVNTPDEITLLSPIFSNVTFVSTDRTAVGILNKPLIFLDDLLRALRSVNTRIGGIINSDIILNDSEDLIPFLLRECSSSLIYGQRNEIDAFPAANRTPYYFGRDYFFFEMQFIDTVPPSNFAMGAPWWDWWLPLVAANSGMRLVQPFELVAQHVAHKQVWSGDHYAYTSIEITNLINTHNFSILNNTHYQTVENLLLEHGKDAGILHLIIDHLSDHTIVLSTNSDIKYTLTVKPAWEPFRPILSVIISDVFNKNLEFLLKCILILEQQEFSQELELVILLDERMQNDDFIRAILEFRWKHWNITYVRSKNNLNKSKNKELTSSLSRGNYVIFLDPYVPFNSDNSNTQSIVNDHYYKRFNGLLKKLNSYNANL